MFSFNLFVGSRRKSANLTLFDECDRERLSVAKALLYVTEFESVLWGNDGCVVEDSKDA